MKTCCICQTQTKGQSSKWATCNKPKCRKEANRLKRAAQSERIAYYKLNPSLRRQRNIDRMREELSTQEEFARAIIICGGSHKIAQKYRVITQDVAALRTEFFGEAGYAQIHKMGKELLAEERPKVKPTGRQPIPTIVYQVTDWEAFEKARADFYAGLPARNDGLEYVRTDEDMGLGLPVSEANCFE